MEPNISAMLKRIAETGGKMLYYKRMATQFCDF
jgi:hypothetical protein